MGRKCVLTSVEFEDKANNYLKTIYEIGKNIHVKVLIEVNGIWDYRTETQKDNTKESKETIFESEISKEYFKIESE